MSLVRIAAFLPNLCFMWHLSVLLLDCWDEGVWFLVIDLAAAAYSSKNLGSWGAGGFRL